MGQALFTILHAKQILIAICDTSIIKLENIAMAIMKGVIVEKAGAPYKVVDNLEVPEPGEHQVLVKSIATAINPV